MSSEARISASLSINQRAAGLPLVYNSIGPSSFTADVTGAIGPTPGTIAAPVDGANVDLSLLSYPGLCELYNQGTDFAVEVGIWDPDHSKFFPLCELLPGEKYPMRLSRHLGGEYSGGPGTGTTGPSANRLRVRGIGGTGYIYVGAFQN